MLSAQDLSSLSTPARRSRPALRGMSLEIPAGQFVTVIGSNGSASPPSSTPSGGDLAWTPAASPSTVGRAAPV